VEQLELDRSRLERENTPFSPRSATGLVAQRDQLQQDLDEMAILLNASDRVNGDIKDILAANQKWRKALEEARLEISALNKREGGCIGEISFARGPAHLDPKGTAGTCRKPTPATNGRWMSSTGASIEMLTQLDARTEQVTSLTKEQGWLEGLAGPERIARSDHRSGCKSPRRRTATLANAKEENDLLP